MRRALLVLLLFVPLISAQVPEPDEVLVHHPLTIQAKMEEIQAMNPDFIMLESFGQSTAGFPLWAMQFHAPSANPEPLKHVPVFYLDANHHGNEQLGMEALLIFMEEVAQWSLTPEGEARLAQIAIVAAPMINPDGTGRNNRVNSNFVDLNRNYDYHWGLYGTSDNASPTGGTYRGDAPASEPESKANQDLMQMLRPSVYLSMHTGSHDIVLPWRAYDGGGNELDGPMPDWPTYEHYLDQIQNVSGLGYRDPSGAGESISYGYGALGAVSLIVEVDNLQSQVAVQDRPERLKEEVAIFWDTVDRLEWIGGHLRVEGDRVCSDGSGPAYNLTAWVNQHDHQITPFLDMLAPGQCAEVPALGLGTHVSYMHTAQAGLHAEPGMALHWNHRVRMPDLADLDPAGNNESAPGWGIAGLLAAIAFAIRRRAA